MKAMTPRETNLPYFAGEQQDDIEEYEELPIGGDGAAPAPPPPPSSIRTHGRFNYASRHERVKGGAEEEGMIDRGGGK